INLAGNYTGSTFVAASDGHGGTIVHDPKAAAAVAPPHVFIAAMAVVGVVAAAPTHPNFNMRAEGEVLLASGRSLMRP
ncbi:MAG: hypothetical protein M3Y22_12320, partial [Pseudomonadota bacterium]|nr:hypothetical protein [Pseudomonadota bacterium]